MRKPEPLYPMTPPRRRDAVSRALWCFIALLAAAWAIAHLGNALHLWVSM